MTTTSAPDFTAIKEKQRATWASGDYAVIGTKLQIVGEVLCETVDIAAGSRVLDVAAGNGVASLAAARRGALVTATDYVGALLDRAARRADADGVALETQVADAEALPFDDATFDTVLSTFGVMFTPDHQRAADELLRVCVPGGRIGLANWEPSGFIGQVFGVVGRHVPPPPGVTSPLAWGTADHVRELLGDRADVAVTERTFTFRARSAVEWFETFRDFYGPIVKAWEALDEAGRRSLRDGLVDLAERADRNPGDSMAVDSTYLEVVATKR